MRRAGARSGGGAARQLALRGRHRTNPHPSMALAQPERLGAAHAPARKRLTARRKMRYSFLDLIFAARLQFFWKRRGVSRNDPWGGAGAGPTAGPARPMSHERGVSCRPRGSPNDPGGCKKPNNKSNARSVFDRRTGRSDVLLQEAPVSRTPAGFVIRPRRCSRSERDQVAGENATRPAARESVVDRRPRPHWPKD